MGETMGLAELLEGTSPMSPDVAVREREFEVFGFMRSFLGVLLSWGGHVLRGRVPGEAASQRLLLLWAGVTLQVLLRGRGWGLHPKRSGQQSSRGNFPLSLTQVRPYLQCCFQH